MIAYGDAVSKVSSSPSVGCLAPIHLRMNRKLLRRTKPRFGIILFVTPKAQPTMRLMPDDGGAVIAGTDQGYFAAR